MIYVVRHGQTDWNKEGRLQGRQGLPLNEVGVEQAKRMGEALKGVKFDYVFSSPQGRAAQTAELATGLKPSIDARLDVFDLGEADGLKKSEVALAGIVPDSRIYKGVEDIQHYIHRVFGFMEELQRTFGSREVDILVAGHRCTTGGIGAFFEGIPQDGNIMKYASENGNFKKYAFK